MVLQEYTRARAGNAGMGEIAVVTVWERPTRVILTAFLLLACGLLPTHAVALATLGAATWIALGTVGLAQILTAVHRRLT
jgi:CDP-diacylglycerol--glycerol-3-phosphate 3-phosphatidyltransferase